MMGGAMLDFDSGVAKLEEEARMQRRVSAKNVQALFGMVSARNFDSAAKEIVDAAVELLGADMGNVQVLLEDGAGLEMVAQRGFEPEFLKTFRLIGIDADTSCARAARMGRRVAIEDVETDEEFAPHASISLQAGFRSCQSTPLIGSGGNVIGVLSTHFRDTHRPSQREERMLDVLAPAAGVLLERVRAEEQLKQLATSLERRVDERTAAFWEKERQVRVLAAQAVMAEQQERGRVAQRLHDNLQQVLFGIEIKVDLLSQALLRFDPALLGRSEEVHALLKRAIEITRTLTIELAPAPTGFEEGGLQGALAWLIQQMQQLHNLTVTLNSDGDLNVAKEPAVLIFGIMRELLFNVAKHAQSGKASLDMKRNGRMLQIHVRDEGVGFDVASLAARQTYGMQQIRRHVALLNGALKIDSAAGQGTAISITFDLEPEALPGRESFPTFT